MIIFETLKKNSMMMITDDLSQSLEPEAVDEPTDWKRIFLSES